MKSFFDKSEYLLLNFLKEPGALSFFPSSFFWRKDIIDLEKKYLDFFSSDLYLKKDKKTKNLLYVHIPFCSKICSYCNCFKYKLNFRDEIKKYLSYLDLESKKIYELNNFKKIKIDGIFIGGGTPNILNSDEFELLYKIIDTYFIIDDIDDFILDGHPNHYNKNKLDLFKKIGVTRITFAIQTFDKKVLIENNRDFYDFDSVLKNLSYAKNLGIKVNLDLLIGLKGQTIDSFINDMQILKDLPYDNLSVHYFMNSNNILYKIDSNYHDLVKFSKNYFIDNDLASNSSNKFEDYFASTKNTTISIGASSVTNIFGSIIYSKPDINDFYLSLDKGIIPYDKGLTLTKRDEMIKFIYLNILYGININSFFDLYGLNIFKEFFKEFKFLRENDIIFIDNNIIYSKKSDLDTLTYFNIFFLEKFSFFDLNKYNKSELGNFFLSKGELIDK